jgi:hypothetical protein
MSVRIRLEARRVSVGGWLMAPARTKGRSLASLGSNDFWPSAIFCGQERGKITSTCVCGMRKYKPLGNTYVRALVSSGRPYICHKQW